MTKYYLWVFLGLVITNPSVLAAEDRPGFYSSEFRSFERDEYVLGVNTARDGGSASGESTGVSCVGNNCTSHKSAFSVTSNGYAFGMGLSTPHFNKLSFGALTYETNRRFALSDGTQSETDTWHEKALDLAVSYLMSPDNMLSGSIREVRGSFANETQRTFRLQYDDQVSSNFLFSVRLEGLLGDKFLTNGIKHANGTLSHKSSFEGLDLNAFLDIHSYTNISRSEVSGIQTASEERYRGIASGGSIHLRRDASKFGVIGNFSISDRLGTPKSISVGPQYIYTAPNFEIAVTGNYRIDRSDNVSYSDQIIKSADTVTKDLGVSYVQEMFDGYYLNASITRNWTSQGFNILDTEVQSASDGHQWRFNIGMTRQF